MRSFLVLCGLALLGCATPAGSGPGSSGDAGSPAAPDEEGPDGSRPCDDCGAPSDAGDAGVDERGETSDGGDFVPDPDGGAPWPPPAASSCEELAAGYYAIRTDLDVWWPGTEEQIDPGRGTVSVHALAQRIASERDGEPGASRIKLCGVALPTFTADATCRALALELSSAAFDDGAPRWSEVRSAATIAEGDVLRWSEVVSFAGSDGAGFPDDDGDGEPGVSADVRADDDEYIVPFDMERCSEGSPYSFGRWPVNPGRGKGSPRGAVRLHVGLAVRPTGDALLANDCKCSVSQLEEPLLELNVAGCESTLDVARNDNEETAHASCSEAELAQLQDTLPALHVLSFGETPQETLPPRGWTRRSPVRDIDRRLSQGPRTRIVHLGDDRSESPSCAEVRSLMQL